MIGIYKSEITGIPALTVLKAENVNKPLPVITYYHGFTSAKEHNLPLAYLLAEKGFRVILPDSQLHGERENGAKLEQKQLAFWDTILKNVDELKQIKNYLEEKKLILNNNFGVAGTSMGGMTTSAALTAYPWIKAAAILMGSPKLTEFAKAVIHEFGKDRELPVTEAEIDALYDRLKQYDLSLQPEKLNERPLFLWHGQKDPVVPYDHAHSFYEETAKLYSNQAEIHMVSEPERDHKVSRAAILQTTDWFDRYLNK